MGGVGVSIVNTLWEKREALHHTQLTEQITPYSNTISEAIGGMMQQGLSREQVMGQVVRAITQQGFIIGSNEIFWGGSILFVVMIAAIWFAKPPFSMGGRK